MDQAGGKWAVEFGKYKFLDVDFRTVSSRIPGLQIYSYDPSGARDFDHDVVRSLYIEVQLPQWKNIYSDWIDLSGYVEEVMRYPEGQSAPIEGLCDGGQYCRIGEEHPFIDAYLPPTDESFKPGVYEITLRRY